MRQFLIGTFSYFLSFTLVGAVLSSYDEAARRPIFAVIGETPQVDFWPDFWSFFPGCLATSASIAALTALFYLLFSWLLTHPRQLLIARFTMISGLAGAVNSFVIVNYLIVTGRAIYPRPWYESPLFASFPSMVIFMLLTTSVVACLAVRLARGTDEISDKII
jgi:hypothetical protein